MPTNDFLAYATAGGANVKSQVDYAAAAARTAGAGSGIADSGLANKAWRQGSVMAAAVAQTICDITGDDVLDDGNLTTLVAKLKAALIPTITTNSNGTCIELPGGYKLQKGVKSGVVADGTATVTFPVAFDNPPIIYGTSLHVAAYDNTKDAVSLVAGTPTETTMVVVNNQINGSPVADVQWYAEGE